MTPEQAQEARERQAERERRAVGSEAHHDCLRQYIAAVMPKGVSPARARPDWGPFTRKLQELQEAEHDARYGY